MTEQIDFDVILRVWAPRVTGSLSILGSSCIIYNIIREYERKIRKPNNRFLLMMSFIDVLSSFALALSTAPIPKESMVYGAIGNDATCTAQAFFIQLGFAVPYCNASLCIYYLLHIKYNMNPKVFQKNIEPFLHGWSVLYPLTTAIACVFMGWFGNYWDQCWINSNTCSRFDCLIEQLMFAGIGLVVCFFVITGSLVSIISFYNKIETAVERYNFATGRSHQNGRASNEKKEASVQAVLYIIAFLVTYLSSYVYNCMYAIDQTNHKVLNTITSFTLPLQGFMNFFIYARPIIKRIRKNNQNISLLRAFQIMFSQKGDPQVRPQRPQQARRRSWRRSITELINEENRNRPIERRPGFSSNVHNLHLQRQLPAKMPTENNNINESTEDEMIMRVDDSNGRVNEADMSHKNDRSIADDVNNITDSGTWLTQET